MCRLEIDFVDNPGGTPGLFPKRFVFHFFYYCDCKFYLAILTTIKWVQKVQNKNEQNQAFLINKKKIK